MSRPCPWVTLVRPVTRPALVMRCRPWLRAHPVQIAVLVLARDAARDVDAPGVAVRVEVERAERDLRPRSVHPISLRCTRSFQMPSHWRFWPLMPISASAIAPDGFVSKK